MTTVCRALGRSSSLDPEEQANAGCGDNNLCRLAVDGARYPWPSKDALDGVTVAWRSLPERRLDPGYGDALMRAALALYAHELAAAVGGRLALAALGVRDRDRLWQPWLPAWQAPPAVAGWPAIAARLYRFWYGPVRVYTGGRERTSSKAPGWHRRVARILKCKTTAAEYSACNGELRYRPVTCGSFACQRCMREARQRQVRVARELLKTFRAPPRMVTLTLPSWPRPLGMRQHLRDAFSRLRRSRWWRLRVRGGFVVEEFEWREETGAHVHLHIAADAGFLPVNALVVEWQRACGCRCWRDENSPHPQLCAFTEGWTIQNDGKSTHGRYAWAAPSDVCPGRFGGMPSPAGQSVDIGHDALERELAKYLSKGFMGGAATWPAWVLADVLAMWWGRPRLTRFGSCVGIEVDLDPEMPVHAACGARCWEFSGSVPWAVYAAWMEAQEPRPPPPGGPGGPSA